MFRFLTTKLRRTVSPSPRALPAGLLIYAIGDIHGRADLLRDITAQVQSQATTQTNFQLSPQSASQLAPESRSPRDSPAPTLRNLLIYLGDYVDRGPDSKAVIDFLLAGPPPGFEAIYLKGNHEEALLHFLEEPSFGEEWRHYGGLETLQSYGVKNVTSRIAGEGFERARDEFEELLPASHRTFLEGLEISATFGDYFFAHAGVRPGVSLDDQIEQDLLWIREDFVKWTGRFGKVVVHGHTITAEPELLPNRIGIDTGAYLSNTLSCVVLEGDTRTVLQTGAD